MTKKIEIMVGTFMLLGILALVFLMLKVANVSFDAYSTYKLYAEFDNVGGLAVGAPVKVGGVVVGQVASIDLNDQTLKPSVSLNMNIKYYRFPETSSLSILTSGLLGSQYLGLTPGFYDDDVAYLEDGDTIFDTNSALILEDLIGKFLYQSPQNQKD